MSSFHILARSFFFLLCFQSDAQLLRQQDRQLQRPIRADSTAISQNVATAETATHSHFNNQWESAKHLSRKPLLRSLLAKARSMSCRLSSSWCVFKSAARAKLNCTQMFSLLSSPAVCIYLWENQTKQQITTKKKKISPATDEFNYSISPNMHVLNAHYI